MFYLFQAINITTKSVKRLSGNHDEATSLYLFNFKHHKIIHDNFNYPLKSSDYGIRLS